MGDLVTQPDGWPTRKVGAAGLAGAGATVLVWTAQQIGVDMPAEVAAGFVTLAGFGAAYLVRERAR